MFRAGLPGFRSLHHRGVSSRSAMLASACLPVAVMGGGSVTATRSHSSSGRPFGNAGRRNILVAPASGVLSTASRGTSSAVTSQAESSSGQKRFVSDDVLLAILADRDVSQIKRRNTKVPLGEKTDCPYCDTVFEATDNSSTVKQHLKAKHWVAKGDAEDAKPTGHTCTHCNEAFTEFSQFYRHLGPRFQCTSIAPRLNLPSREQLENMKLATSAESMDDVAALGQPFSCPFCAVTGGEAGTASEGGPKTGEGHFGADDTLATVKAHILEKHAGPAQKAKPVEGADPLEIPAPHVNCANCKTDFPSSKAFARHLDYSVSTLPCKTLQESVDCPFCPEDKPTSFGIVDTEQAVVNHIAKEHWQQNPQQPRAARYKCPQCFSAFRNFKDLTAHLTPGTFRCGGATAERQASIVKLKNTVTCPYCTKAGGQADVQHRFEEGTAQSAYATHLKEVHWKNDIYNKEEPFYCECGLGFYNFSAFMTHMGWPNATRCFRHKTLPRNWRGPFQPELLSGDVRQAHFARVKAEKAERNAQRDAEDQQRAAAWEAEEKALDEQATADAAAAINIARADALKAKAEAAKGTTQERKKHKFPLPPTAAATPPPSATRPTPPVAKPAFAAKPKPAPAPPAASAGWPAPPTQNPTFAPPPTAPIKKAAEKAPPLPTQEKKIDPAVEAAMKEEPKKKKKKARLGRFT